MSQRFFCNLSSCFKRIIFNAKFFRYNLDFLKPLHRNTLSVYNFAVDSSSFFAASVFTLSLKIPCCSMFKLHSIVYMNINDAKYEHSDSYDNFGFLLYCWLTFGVGASLSLSHLDSKKKNKQVNSCGIVAYIGNRDADTVLLEGIEILQNRGYDSCGISTIGENNTLITTKYASYGTTSDCVEILKRESGKFHKGHHIGIAHTRWATHGAKTDINAHPHHDYQDRISVIHNGTIENYGELKKKLLSEGINFRSETDTEVISNLIGYYMDKGNGFEDAVRCAVDELQGTWGLCVMHKDLNDRLVLARNGSPLLVGGSEREVFIASEPAALARYTNQYFTLKDGEIAVITAHGIDQLSASHSLQAISIENVEVSPSPYEHWTLKEIYEQPQSLARALNYGARMSSYENKVKLGGLDSNKDSLLTIKNLVIAGCGTSLHAGMYGKLLMEYLLCFDSCCALDASEIDAHSFPKHNAGLLLLSQSGETLDTVRACQIADNLAIKRLSVVNSVGSFLARMTNCGVYLNAGREVGVASTKAFTSQVVVLSLMAAWFAQNREDSSVSSDRVNALMDAIHRIPVYAGMTLGCMDQCAAIARKIKNAKTMFVLGKGFGYPAALEGALKIKEISYIHAEGFPGGALKHGPFALIDDKEKTPVILLIFSDQHSPLMINALQQIKARGAYAICITDDYNLVKDMADETVVIPSNGPLTALVSVICLQMLAYQLAKHSNINPDKPRGLAKTVTVS